MSTSSSTTTTHDSDSFVCECNELLRIACVGETFYKEHDGKRYCVLHYPGTEKKEDFQKALERKLSAEDFDFRGVWFPDEVSFLDFTFSAAADFYNAQFNAAADFSFAQFNAAAYFDNVVFNGNAYFQSTTFIEKDVSLDRIVNTSKLSFTGARFNDIVIFEKNKFAGQALLRFSITVFEKPERVTFHTVALRPHWFINVDSRKFNFIDVDWGLLDRRDAVRKEINALEGAGFANAPRLLAITFRQLAVNAEENNRYEEAANFRYMAMDVKRIERGFIENLFSLGWWYWVLSGYGERVQRAFAALIVIWLLFVVLYWSGNATWWQPKQAGKAAAESSAGEKQPPAGVERQGVAAAQPLTLPDALIYSFGVMALQKPEPLPANKRAKGLVLLETILGPLQAALLALAIRRKFMR